MCTNFREFNFHGCCSPTKISPQRKFLHLRYLPLHLCHKISKAREESTSHHTPYPPLSLMLNYSHILIFFITWAEKWHHIRNESVHLPQSSSTSSDDITMEFLKHTDLLTVIGSCLWLKKRNKQMAKSNKKGLNELIHKCTS